MLIPASLFIRSAVVGKKVHIDVQKIEQNIDFCFSQTNSSPIEQWLATSNDSLFITSLWWVEKPKQWQDRRISLFMFKGDSLVLWSNYIYSDEIHPNQFPENDKAFEWNGKKVIAQKQTRGDKTTIVLLNLESPTDGLNPSVFQNNQLTLHCNNYICDRSEMIAVGNKFYIEPFIQDQVPIISSVLSWLGVFLLMAGIKRRFRESAKVKDILEHSFIFLGVAVLTGVYFTLTNSFIYPSVLANSIVLNLGNLRISVANFMIIFVLVQLYTIYLYQVRRKIKIQYLKLSRTKQIVLLLFSLIGINIIVVFFHCGMINIIYHTSINVELYNFTLVDHNTIAFYFIGSAYVAIRILLNSVVRTIFDNRHILLLIILSITILILMILPIWGQINNSGYILIACHVLFLVFSFLYKKGVVTKIYIPIIAVFALYIMMFAIVESQRVADENAREYAKILASGNTQSPDDKVQFQELTYFKIQDNNIEVKENNSVDLQLLNSLIEQNIDTTITINGYTHLVIHTPDNKTIVVSSDQVTLLDYLAFFAYIYLFLYLFTGGILKIAGYRYSTAQQKGRVVIKIRLAVIAIIILTMTMVIIVITITSFNSYDSSQRKLINNQIMSMISNFDEYDKTSELSDSTLLKSWFIGNSIFKNKTAFIYTPQGELIATSIPFSTAYRRMDSKAYTALKYHNLALYNNQIEYKKIEILNTAYIPISDVNNDLLGYLCLFQKDRSKNLAEDPRFDVLIHIFNILIVVVLISLVLSMSLYRMLTVPLNKLYLGMSDISALRPIKESDGEDEVALLIRQYNRMIEYLKESYEALANSERESAWREMAQQVSHEIKNPLTPMRLKIQMLQQYKRNEAEGLSEKIDSTLDMLLEQIDLLAKIASEFSDFSKIGDPKVEHFDVTKILTTVRELYTNNESFTFEVVIGSEELMINADYSQMSRVIINLCQNAIQAVAEKTDGHIKLSAARYSDHIMIRVKDNGSGISEKAKKRIFQQHFTTKNSGSGLGLAISRQIVRNAGGDIFFESHAGGTIFTVRLPYGKNPEKELVRTEERTVNL